MALSSSFEKGCGDSEGQYEASSRHGAGGASEPPSASQAGASGGVTAENGYTAGSNSFVRHLSRMGSTFGRRISRTLSLETAPSPASAEAAAQARWQRISSAQMLDGDFLDGADSPGWLALRQTLAAFEETFVVARLAIRLSLYLGLGWRWMVKLLRLVIYALLLLPGFIRMGIFYLFSPRVVRSITYGPNPRNRLDLFIPQADGTEDAGPYPVVIYVTGGAWTIGYKAWGSLLGRRLSKQGVLVCCLDYRNFPQGSMLEMLEDVNTGIRWALMNLDDYGGDLQRVFLVGQSCGAQLVAQALLTQTEQAVKATKLPGGYPRWQPHRIRALVGVSGVYNCHDLADHFDRRGLYKGLFTRIMAIDGQPQLKLFSPIYCIQGVDWGPMLPPVLLLHGDADTCAPIASCRQFREALQRAGAEVTMREYPGETHTSPLIENPMRGGRDDLSNDILACVLGCPHISVHQSPLCPSLLIKLAAWVCPF